jgi:hemoglobin-like flavoprotein
MEATTVNELFLDSLERCTRSKKFIPAFYNRFLSASDDISDKFRHTDFGRQNRMLLRSLKLAAYAADGQSEGLREIRERAVSHGRHHLNIEPRLYNFWRSALIETSRQFDGQWDDDIEEAWLTILEHVISQMIKHY